MAQLLARSLKLATPVVAQARCAINKDSFLLPELARLAAAPDALLRIPARNAMALAASNAKNRWRSRSLPEWKPDQGCACKAKGSRAPRVVRQEIFMS